MPAELIDRRPGVAGELALYRRDGQLELVVAGTFAMATGEADSERDMISRSAALAKRPVRQVLIGGLGAGLSAAAALSLPGVEGVTVVELEPWVIEWNRTHFAPFNRRALQDPRLTLVAGDFAEAVQGVSPGSYDLVAVDTDNGPDWLLRAENAAIYGAEGIAACGRALRAGGVLAVWTADPCLALAQRLRAMLGPVSRRDYLRLAGDRELLNTVYYALKPEETSHVG